MHLGISAGLEEKVHLFFLDNTLRSDVMILTLQTKSPVTASRGWLVLYWLLFGLVVLTSLPVDAKDSGTRDLTSGGISSPAQLNTLSQQLIEQVKTGTAQAIEFRTNVVYYRESLRSLMLANEKSTKQRIADSLLMQMVRMAALLQSAAECQTGRYISCPANLVIELDRQQHQLTLAFPNATASP